MAVETQTFTYTGSMESFVVPAHRAGTLHARCYGGRGANAQNGSPLSVGGPGGSVGGYLDVSPGDTLYVIAGGGAADATHSTAGFGPAEGGEGGDGGYDAGAVWNGGAGGCASEVRTGTGVGTRIMVAGGGGGGGGKGALVSANSGGAGGDGVAAGSDGERTQKGYGGTLSAAGAGGTGTVNGTAGSAGTGGDGGSYPFYGGGGGGGGYYGGGGGAAATSSGAGTGGGGSTWADTGVVTVVGPDDINNGEGYVVFSWETSGGWKVGSL